jgi:putative acetyltransferase
MVAIRRERPADAAAVRHVHERAFGRNAEAGLVDALRAACKAVVSLVAQEDDQVVGHILFSLVTIAGAPTRVRCVGLAPVSVLPEFQNKGIGSRLVREGLVACRDAGCNVVVVLGRVGYYSRFDFVRASDFGLQNEYGATDAFMVIELDPGILENAGGLVRFAREFDEAGC